MHLAVVHLRADVPAVARRRHSSCLRRLYNTSEQPGHAAIVTCDKQFIAALPEVLKIGRLWPLVPPPRRKLQHVSVAAWRPETSSAPLSYHAKSSQELLPGIHGAGAKQGP